jgi:hypothetical protein
MMRLSRGSCAIATAFLMLLARDAAAQVNADTAVLTGKVSWGQRAVCDGSQGRKLVFSGDAGKAEASIDEGGRYSVSLAPGRYRVTLRCGGADVKSLDVIGYPTPTQQDLAF